MDRVVVLVVCQALLAAASLQGERMARFRNLPTEVYAGRGAILKNSSNTSKKVGVGWTEDPV